MAEITFQQLAYIAEVTQGTTPATPQTKEFKHTPGGNIKISRGANVSQEVRKDRGVSDVRLGNCVPSLDVPIEFAYGNFDDFLEGALFGEFTANVLKQGITKKFFSIEEGFTDIAQYRVMQGAMVDTFDLSIQPNKIVTGAFGFKGLTVTEFSGTSICATPTAALANSPFDSFTGSLEEGGSAIAIATALSLKLNNGLANYFTLFNKDIDHMGVGAADITGTMTAFFNSAALANKFMLETGSSLEFELIDPVGNKYAFLLPKIKYTGGDIQQSQNEFVVNMPFKALTDGTSGTIMQITRTPRV